MVEWLQGVRKWLIDRGLLLPGKIMYIGGSDTLPPPLPRCRRPPR